ncbi:MAG TPA: ATP-binding protein [Polyangiaceae bacterium]|nr:ATP-binding protein [Polyangiaceae bacterium]
MTGVNAAVGDGHPRVLVVDDEAADLLALEAVLDGLDLNVVTARSGRQALEKLREGEFALVLLDVRMPDWDGFETAKRIRAQEQANPTPIIFLTGYDSSDFPVAQAYRMGAVDYMVKPYAPEILRAKVTGFVELYRARRQAEAALRQTDQLLKVAQQTAAELARSNRDLEQFAYVASHDLQEPLRMVTLHLQLLERRCADRLDDEMRAHTGKAVAGARRMRALIKDLLAYSRVAGAGTLPNESVDCSPVFEEAVANLAAAIQESNASVTCGRLPTVHGDRGQLVELLQNLIDNAIKFRSSHPPKVYVEARNFNGEWRFAVRDNGIGIDPRHHERLFNLFQRLHSSQDYPGTGIGLALCKRIVEHHGGRIWVESLPGEGTTFHFTLPDWKGA